MRHILLIVFLTILAASPALAQSVNKPAPSKRSVENQLIELERQLSDALVRQDAAALDRCGATTLSLRSPMAKCPTRHSE